MGNLLNFLIIEPVIVFKQQVVKLPEFSLTAGSKGCNRRLHGEFVVLKRKVFKGHFDILQIFFEHLLEYRHQPGTVRSLKIIEDGNHHGGIFGSLKRSAAGIDFLDKVKTDNLNGFVLAAAQNQRSPLGA